jgi:hypothetical protein
VRVAGRRLFIDHTGGGDAKADPRDQHEARVIMEVEAEPDDKRPPAQVSATAAGDESSLNQTGFLLQRLQDLKRWQQEQEKRLLRDQQLQMEQLKKEVAHGDAQRGSAVKAGHLADDDEDDDDPTIDQDVSSLTSYEELPASTDTFYSSAFDEDDGDLGTPQPLLNEPPIPSWASRADTTATPKTVVQVASAAAKTTTVSTNPDDRPVGNKKTFEELLAEQLGIDAQDVRQVELTPPQAPVQHETSGSGQSKAFLRKGSGLARFGGVGGVAVTPITTRRAMTRSKSQSSVRAKGSANGQTRRRLSTSTSCSRLDIADRETISSASKKAPPKRSLSIKSVSSVSSLGKRSHAAAAAASGPATNKQGKTNPTNKVNKEKITPVNRRSNKVGPAPNEEETKMVPAVSVGIDGQPVNRHSADRLKVAGDEDVSPVHDSVEWSFREKLKKADENHKVLMNAIVFLQQSFCLCHHLFGSKV